MTCDDAWLDDSIPGWTLHGYAHGHERERVVRLVVDRPDKRNAVSLAMWRSLPEVLARLASDPRCHVLLVEGAGDTFCAGADIGDLLAGPHPDPMRPLREANLAALDALRTFPRPTLAVVRGSCIGGGLELALACDIRIGGPDAVLGVTPARLGVVYHPPSIRMLRDRVGPGVASYLLLSGRLVDAPTAVRMGLLDLLLDSPGEILAEQAWALALEMAQRSALTQAAAKEVLLDLEDPDRDLRGRLGSPGCGTQIEDRYLETIRSGELIEGVQAFQERRRPIFPWRPDGDVR